MNIPTKKRWPWGPSNLIKRKNFINDRHSSRPKSHLSALRFSPSNSRLPSLSLPWPCLISHSTRIQRHSATNPPMHPLYWQSQTYNYTQLITITPSVLPKSDSWLLPTHYAHTLCISNCQIHDISWLFMLDSFLSAKSDTWLHTTLHALILVLTKSDS